MAITPAYIGANPIGKAVTSFFAGAVGSATVAVTAATTALVLVTGAALTVTDTYLRDSATAAYWPRNAIDDYAFASIAARRAASQTAGRPALYLTGTAAMREGLLPPAEIQARLSRLVGREVPVVNLMTGGQSALEVAGLVNEVAPTAKGLLALAVSPSRMAASETELQKLLDHPRLAFWNDGIRREAEALHLTVPRQTGTYLLDNLQFYVVRLPTFAANLLTGTRPENDVQTYLGRGREDGEGWSKDIGILSRRLANYDRNFPVNIASYRRVIRAIKERNLPLKVALLDIPLNSKAIAQATSPGFYPNHVANLERFCREEGCLYVNINPKNLLKDDVFFDWSHISTQEGKRLFTDYVLNDVKGAL